MFHCRNVGTRPKESYFGLLICHSNLFEPFVRLKIDMPVSEIERTIPESASSVT